MHPQRGRSLRDISPESTCHETVGYESAAEKFPHARGLGDKTCRHRRGQRPRRGNALRSPMKCWRDRRVHLIPRTTVMTCAGSMEWGWRRPAGAGRLELGRRTLLRCRERG